jgi:hypothetical protein
MRTQAKLGLAALTAAVLLAAAVGSASARSFEVNNQNIRITWASLEFNGSEFAEPVRCRVTLEGSFHTRTIAKVREALIGAITRATVAHPCITGGEGFALNGVERTPNTLPWHVQYDSFEGTLPRISAITVILSRSSFLINNGICAGRYGNETDRIFGRTSVGAGGELGTITPIVGRNSATLVTRLSGIFCPGNGQLTGTGNVTQLNSASRITVRLI